MKKLIKIDWTKENAGKLLNAGFKLYHVFAPEGFAYVFSKEMPVIHNALIVAEIPPKFAYNPRLYPFRMWYNGHFWHAFTTNENDKEFIFSKLF